MCTWSNGDLVRGRAGAPGVPRRRRARENNRVDSAPFALSLRVRPRYRDAQGMVYAGRYHEFCEDAFLGMLEQLGIPYRRWREQGVDLVISEAHYCYRRPAHLDDDLYVAVAAEVTTESTVAARFEVGRDGELLATALIRYVAVRESRRCQVPDELARSFVGAVTEDVLPGASAPPSPSPR